ncbi:hypothetical protein KIN20_035451 [Parelaphostrongylus tenuis]|uniref:Uncharacterized protein n=1 Tax=Parelaphostrongylus tenuis TaxID=148309 RepID=A0AAD5WKG3_PARTN|nr:hypothetical protein KIN20_035451 [Parelaphostrongylus tenuis]
MLNKYDVYTLAPKLVKQPKICLQYPLNGFVSQIRKLIKRTADQAETHPEVKVVKKAKADNDDAAAAEVTVSADAAA